jgi:hypothetical protein
MYIHTYMYMYIYMYIYIYVCIYVYKGHIYSSMRTHIVV